MAQTESETLTVSAFIRMLNKNVPPLSVEINDEFKALRRKEKLPDLTVLAVDWMAQLPVEVQPLHCARYYPRVLNSIAELWDTDHAGQDYLCELLRSKRKTRQGFPALVVRELQELDMHYLRLRCEKVSAVTQMLNTSGPSLTVVINDEFKVLRRKEKLPDLTAIAAAWMAQLPVSVQPFHCAWLYPRVINSIAELWDTEHAGQDYLCELIRSKRKTRQGFPAPVARELQELDRHYLQRRCEQPLVAASA